MQKIFISSTFRDMQAERDAIHTTVVPELRRIAQKYGEDVEFCDLRWGVNTGDLDSEEGAEKVLSVCLDEIDKCKPFMIIILGERYGWIPKPELLQSVAERKNYQLEELEKSVTALEIEYGALNNPEVLERSIFLFREPILGANEDYQSEGEEYAKRLNALKNRIRKLAGERLFYYQLGWDKEKGVPTQIEHFTTIVIKQLQILLEQEWQKNAKLSENQKEEKRHWGFVKMKSQQFRGRNQLLEDCKQMLETQKRMLLIEGEAGSGKSTLWSKMVLDYYKKGWKVYPFVCGHIGRSSCAMDIIKQWLFYVEDLLGIEHFEEELYRIKEESGIIQKETFREKQEKWEMRLRDVLSIYGNNEEFPPLLLAVDGVDQLYQDELAENFWFLPFFKHKKVHYLLSCHKDFDKKNYEGDCILIGDMTREEQMEVLTGILSYQRKELNQAVIEEIIKKEGADNPLYLGLLIQRLVMMDKQDFDVIAEYGNDMAAITQYQVELVKQAPQHLEEMSKLLIQETGKRVNSELVQRMAEYLAVSRQGLRECDLQVLLEKEGIQWNSLDFTHVLYYMPMLFIERKDGQIDLGNRLICAGIREKTDEEKIQRSIFAYLKELPKEDTLRRNEMVYYCYLLDEKEYFLKYLFEADEIAKKIVAQELYRICMEDFGEWFVAVLQGIEDVEYGRKMVSFVIRYFEKMFFNESKLEFEVQIKIYSLISQISEGIFRKLKTTECEKDYSISIEMMGYIYEQQERWGESLEKYVESLSIYRRLYEKLKTIESARDYSICCEKVGDIYRKQDKYIETIARYGESLIVYRKLYENQETQENARKYSNICCKMADVYISQEKHSEAIEKYEESLVVYRKLYENHATWKNVIKYSVMCNKIGDCYMQQGKQKEAMEKYEERVEIYRKLYEKKGTIENAKQYYYACSYAGGIYSRKGILEEATKKFKESLKICQKIIKQEETLESAKEYAISCDNLGDVLKRQHAFAAAFESYKEGLEIYRKLYEKQGSPQSLEEYKVSKRKILYIIFLKAAEKKYLEVSNDIPQIYFSSGMKENNLCIILKYCAKGIKKEDVLVYCSTNITNPDGKKGYVFTYEGIYADDSMNHDCNHKVVLPVCYTDIETCEYEEEYPDYVKCILNDGSEIYFYTSTFTQFFCEVINEIVSLFRR